MLRNKVFSLINIAGLAIGLTSSLLIFLFVLNEYSYDQFHSKKDRIYRMRYKISDFDLAQVPPVLHDHIKSYFPEVEETARFWSRGVSVKIQNESDKTQRFEEDNVHFADPEIFRIFDFELVKGSLDNALQEPFTVVLNKEIAFKYFEDNEVIGKTIFLEGDKEFKVIAVLEDFPHNSHIHFDMLIPYKNLLDLEPESVRSILVGQLKQNWMMSHSPTYVLLRPNANPEMINEGFKEFVKEKVSEQQNKGQIWEIQALNDIHLNDNVQAQSEPPGSPQLIKILSAVGLLTLLIAVINFINLSTAKSIERSREVGMRKVLGAWRKNIIAQFLGESVLLTLIAGIISLLLVAEFLPRMNSLMNKDIGIGVLLEPLFLISFLVLVILTSILSGFYPSIVISAYKPIKSLKNNLPGGNNRGISLRRLLIIVQFTISITLISCTLIVFEQLNYMRNAPMGFDKDFMITVPIQSQNFNSIFGGVDQNKRNNLNTFEEKISKYPEVIGSTLSSNAPGFGQVNRVVAPEGFSLSDNILCPVLSVDFDFIETYGIDVISGRDFDKEYSTDIEQAFVINEKAVEEFEFGDIESAIGKEINLEGHIGKVIGVVKNFNIQDLSNDLSPLIMEITVPQFNTISIKLSNHNIPKTLENIELVWNGIFPDETFTYEFLDESLAQQYDNQEQLGSLIAFFAILAILISCLGSYGLILLISAQKKKEIGIRKVLGANIPHIMILLNRQFFWLILISILLSIPFYIYLGEFWLEDFAYRISVSSFSMVLASLATLLIVLITVSYQSLKAATVNPVNSLRSE